MAIRKLTRDEVYQLGSDRGMAILAKRNKSFRSTLLFVDFCLPTKQQMREWYEAAVADSGPCDAIMVYHDPATTRTHVEYSAADDCYTRYVDGLPVFVSDRHGVCADEVALADSVE